MTKDQRATGKGSALRTSLWLAALCALVTAGCSEGSTGQDDGALNAMAGTFAGTGIPAGGVGGTAGTLAPAGAGGTGAVAGMVAPPPAGAGGVGGEAGTLSPAGAGGAGGEAGTMAGEGGTMAGEGGTMAGEGGTMAGEGGTMAGTGGTGPTGENSCLAGITNFGERGPFMFESKRSGSVNMWIPNVPAGCKVPMVHLANGTGANCATYRASLERLASHGFIALCYESAQTGAGTQAIMAWEAALSQHAAIADMKFGSTGHSQGGQSAFCALRLAEEKWPQAVHAGLAMQPASGFGAACSGGRWQARYALIESPMFMFSGERSDGLVSQSWVQDGFNALNDSIEAYHWAKRGGQHIPVPNGETIQISIPWFRWKLLGDQEACRAFKRIRETDNTWIEAAVQNEAPCL